METNQNVYGVLKDENKIEYKTLFNSNVGQLDDEVIQHLNDGWMPHGPQYYSVKDEWYVQPVLRLPRQMMQQPR